MFESYDDFEWVDDSLHEVDAFFWVWEGGIKHLALPNSDLIGLYIIEADL